MPLEPRLCLRISISSLVSCLRKTGGGINMLVVKSKRLIPRLTPLDYWIKFYHVGYFRSSHKPFDVHLRFGLMVLVPLDFRWNETLPNMVLRMHCGDFDRTLTNCQLHESRQIHTLGDACTNNYLGFLNNLLLTNQVTFTDRLFLLLS